MTLEELEIKKFELEQKVKIEELELKKKDLELKIQEQTSKRIFTPLVISIVGGLITIITGLILKYYDNVAILQLEDKKFQSSLLLKATDAKTYDEFSDMLLALQENGLLSLDSTKIANFRKKRFVAEKLNEINTENSEELAVTSKSDSLPRRDQVNTKIKINPTSRPTPASDKPTTATADPSQFTWIIVAGGDADLPAAKLEQSKSLRRGFKEVHVWQRNNSFRTCIGRFSSYPDAVNTLFDVKEKINNSSYIVRLDKWCPQSTYNYEKQLYVCI